MQALVITFTGTLLKTCIILHVWSNNYVATVVINIYEMAMDPVCDLEDLNSRVR